MQFQIGERVGDYEILAVLGAGGMGKVYKVRNVLSDRFEAMKVLLPDLAGDPELADRFLREIKVQASLTHPNIASLYTALTFKNQLLMLIEFIEGMSIEKLLEAGPLPLDKALDYLLPVLAALQYAHSRGVIHRDIKPANMMVTPEGAVKLMDFGIAKMREDKRLTQTGRTVGSLFYMSPEQIRGGQQLDPRSDIYSLGISLYEIVTGKRPFEGTSDFSIMAAHLQQNPVPPIQVDPALPPLLNEIIMMAIAKDPAARFQSAEAFRNALINVQSTLKGVAPQVAPQMASPPPPAAQPPPHKSHRGLYMALGSLATVAVLVFGAFQLPKYLGTKAAQTPASAPTPAPTSPPVEVQQTPPDTPPLIPPSQPPAPEPNKPATPAPRPKPSSTPAQFQQAQQPQTPAPTPSPQATPQQPAPAPAPVPAQPQPQAPAPAPAPQSPAPAPSQPKPADLEPLRDFMMKIATRFNAVQAKARRIEQEQRTQGLGMRSDVVSGISRATYLLDEAESALRNGSAAAAKSALDRANREISKLEDILGI
ncbi:MAG: serine/threonine protein kinase [Acidobacteria bacterium]|nr:serine/threonine protein kinase [Acidobacteriota bacterium]